MSETIGTPVSRPGIDPPSAARQVTAAVGGPARIGSPVETVHEAYSFACLSCGYGWEQEYEIEHCTDRAGHLSCQYRANGVRVPSPLLKPSCPGCGGTTVRIMNAGRVAAVSRSWRTNPAAPGARPKDTAGAGSRPAGIGPDEATAPAGGRRWHLALPLLLHLRRRHGAQGV